MKKPRSLKKALPDCILLCILDRLHNDARSMALCSCVCRLWRSHFRNSRADFEFWDDRLFYAPPQANYNKCCRAFLTKRVAPRPLLMFELPGNVNSENRCADVAAARAAQCPCVRSVQNLRLTLAWLNDGKRGYTGKLGDLPVVHLSKKPIRSGRRRSSAAASRQLVSVQLSGAVLASTSMQVTFLTSSCMKEVEVFGRLKGLVSLAIVADNITSCTLMNLRHVSLQTKLLSTLTIHLVEAVSLLKCPILEEVTVEPLNTIFAIPPRLGRRAASRRLLMCAHLEPHGSTGDLELARTLRLLGPHVKSLDIEAFDDRMNARVLFECIRLHMPNLKELSLYGDELLKGIKSKYVKQALRVPAPAGPQVIPPLDSINVCLGLFTSSRCLDTFRALVLYPTKRIHIEVFEDWDDDIQTRFEYYEGLVALQRAYPHVAFTFTHNF